MSKESPTSGNFSKKGALFPQNVTPSSSATPGLLPEVNDLRVIRLELLPVLVGFNLWIILSNSVLFGIIWRKVREGNAHPTDCYLINLAIVDILDGFLVLPMMTAVLLLHYFPFSASLCGVWVYWDYFLIVVSSYGYAGLFVNHLRMIRTPASFSHSLTPHVMVIVVFWIGGNLSWGPSFLHMLAGQENPKVCGYNLDSNTYYTLYMGMTGFYVPLFITLICPIYGVILLRRIPSLGSDKLFYNTQFTCRNGRVIRIESTPRVEMQNQARKEQGLLIPLLVTFISSRIPFYVYFGVGAFLHGAFPPDLSQGIYWIIHSNAAVCPIFHFYFDQDIKRTIRTMFSNKCEKRVLPTSYASPTLTLSTRPEISMSLKELSTYMK